VTHFAGLFRSIRPCSSNQGLLRRAWPGITQAVGGRIRLGLLPHEDQNASGCLCIGGDSAGTANKPLQTEPLIYISVEGWLDNAGKTVKSNGGKVLQDQQQIGPHGFRAMIVDSQGNRVTLRSSTA
jgi:uncharacterized protein